MHIIRRGLQESIRRSLFRSLSLALLVEVASLAASGQSEPNASAPVQVRVYVAEFKPAGASKTDLSQFTRQLFELRLRAVPGLDIAEDSAAPPCANPSTLAEPSAEGPGRPTDRKPLPSSVPIFYRVQGTVDVHDVGSRDPAENQSNILIAYELVKTKNCQATLLFRRTRTFGWADALQNLEAATEELSLQLSDDVADKAAVEVDTVEVLGDQKGTYQASDLLTRFIRHRVADADALRLWNNASHGKPAYTLMGRVQFLDAGSSGVRAEVQFFANGEPLRVDFPPRTIRPTSEALIQFYFDASSAAVKGLLDVFYKQRAGLNQISSQGPEALIRKAKQLLCVEPATDSQDCSPDTQAAILALNEARQKPDLANRAELMALIGRADFQDQQYPAAGEAYDEALNTAGGGSAETRLALLKNAGDAWYEAKEYLRAADRYRECVRMGTASQSATAPMRLQPEVRVKLVHSLLLADQPRAALDAWLDDLRAVHNWPNPDDTSKALYSSLSRELAQLLDGLPAKELDSAVGKLESELDYDPGLEASALNQISSTYAAAGRYDAAIAGYRKALSLKSDDADAHFNLGFAFYRKGQYDDAIVEYRKALDLKPNYAMAANNLGVTLYRKGQYDAAIAEYRAALDLEPDYAEARNNLAGALLEKGRFEEAEQLYKKAIQARPNDTLAYYNLWSLYRHLSRHEPAQEVFHNLQKIAPAGDQYALAMLAQVREDDEDFTGAAAIYSKLRQQNPADPYYLADLAMAEIEAGMKNQDRQLIQKAIRRLDQEVTKNPTFVTCFTLAWAYQVVPELRDVDNAARLYKEALNYKPDDLTTLNNLTAITLLKGDFHGVIDEARRALKVNSGDLDALENLGYGQFLANDLHSAIESYERGLATAPDDPVLRICYGEAIFWSHDTARAHAEFSHARDVLSLSGSSGGTWIWLIDARYDAAEKQRAVYYSTVSQKRALIELLEGLTYLREGKIRLALEKYGAAAALLSATREDKEIVRKGINDLHRLGKEPLAQPSAEFGLGYLYDWLGETKRAAEHWRVYLRSGADPVGLGEARRRLAGKMR